MEKKDIVACHTFVAAGMRAWVYINDIPLLPCPMLGSYTDQLPINHRLVAGANRVVVEVDAPGPEELLGTVDRHGPGRLCLDVITGGDAEGEIRHLVQLHHDGVWAGVPEEAQRYPHRFAFTFDHDLEAPPPTWATAARRDDISCLGNDELHDAVRRFYDAIVKGDRAVMAAMSEPLFADDERAYPGEASRSRAKRLAEMDEVIGLAPRYLPLEPDQLHFDPRADGRVVHVSRLDRRPVLVGQTEEETFATDLLLVGTSHGWQVM